MKTYCDSPPKNELEDLESRLKKRKSAFRYKLMRSDDDKKVRREIANNNERRRMKSINVGFDNLRKLLPFCQDNEKLTKAAILQTAAKYISNLNRKIADLEKEIIQTKSSSFTINEQSTEIEVTSFSGKDNQNISVTNSRDFSILSKSSNDLDCSISSSIDPFSISTGGLTNCFDCENNPQQLSLSNIDTTNATVDSTNSELFNQHSNNLEQLLAAAEQVERLEEAGQSIAQIPNTSSVTYNINNSIQSKSEAFPIGSDSTNSNYDLSLVSQHKPSQPIVVLKPTINPFTEEIIDRVSQIQNQQQSYYNFTKPFIVSLTCPAFITTSSNFSPASTTNTDFNSLTYLSNKSPGIPQKSDIFNQFIN